MTLLLPATTGLVGVGAGLALVMWVGLSVVVARIAAVLALMLVMVSSVAASLAPAAAFCVGSSLGMAGLVIWWSGIDPARRRAAQVFDDRTRREIIWHELVGSLPIMLLAVPIVGAGLGSMVRSWPGAVISGLAVVWAGALVGRGRSGTSEILVPPPVDGLVEAGDAGELSEITHALSAGRSGAAVVMYPPVLFRGLAGWNLGLGLDAEQAAWASLMARRSGLGGLLSDVELHLDQDQAAILVTCRAMATQGGEPLFAVAGDMPQATLRRMARVVADHGRGRTITVVTDDSSTGRAFLSRSR